MTDVAGYNSPDNDYLLGTHDDELERLGLQHRVWRSRALDSWNRAGFTLGQTLLDVGCGPGFATSDLAEIVGSVGSVVAVDRSQRFLQRVESVIRQRGLDNVSAHEIDLETDNLPEMQVDGAWCRWVLAFLKSPRRLVEQISKSIRPGGTFVSHEYFAYTTWRMLPPSEELSEFVRVVSAGWRADGGEPDIGLEVPRWLAENGFEIVSARPLIEVITPTDFMWNWPKSFVAISSDRCVELGTITRERADEIVSAFAAREQEPNTMMITPGVLEVIARKL